MLEFVTPPVAPEMTAAAERHGVRRAEPISDGHGWWLRDFQLRKSGQHIATSGADVRVDWTLVGEALVWLKFYLAVSLRYWVLVFSGRRGPRIWFSPQRPRPWYLVRSALAWTGGRLARSPEAADISFGCCQTNGNLSPLSAALPSPL